MDKIQFQKVREDAIVPQRASEGAVGYDVYASRFLDKTTRESIGDLPMEILPNSTAIIGIGIRMAIPFPYECQVRPRGGLSLKYNISLPNSPGTVDPDFRGEVAVIIRNLSEEKFVVEKNMKIAQLIFAKVEIPEFEEVKELSETKRGKDGFGSTGI